MAPFSLRPRAVGCGLEWNCQETVSVISSGLSYSRGGSSRVSVQLSSVYLEPDVCGRDDGYKGDSKDEEDRSHVCSRDRSWPLVRELGKPRGPGRGDDRRCCCRRERVARKTVCELQSGWGHTAPRACSRVTSPGNLVAQGQVFSLHKAQKQCLHRRGAICRGCCVFAPRPYGSALGWTFRVLQRLQTAPCLPLTADNRVSPQCRWTSLLRGPVGRMSSCADVLWEERW